MSLDKKIRKLARSSYWQSIFGASKENGGIHLFENLTNFSGIQSRFLYWLNVYYILNETKAKKEEDFLDNDLIKDDIRVDAYLYYRRKKQEAEWKKYNSTQTASKVKNKNRDNLTTFNVDMRRP